MIVYTNHGEKEEKQCHGLETFMNRHDVSSSTPGRHTNSTLLLPPLLSSTSPCLCSHVAPRGAKDWSSHRMADPDQGDQQGRINGTGQYGTVRRESWNSQEREDSSLQPAVALFLCSPPTPLHPALCLPSALSSLISCSVASTTDTSCMCL